MPSLPPSPAEALSTGVAGLYFDGRTSRAQEVVFSVDAGIATLAGEIDRQCPVDTLRVSQRVRHGVRRITFPDHATLETRDLAGLEAILAAHGFQDGWVVTAEHSPRAILVALLLTIATLGGAYQFGIPAAARAIAFALPASAEQTVGNDALRILDAHWFAPSTLPAVSGASAPS
jgi:hypothetical protein